LLCPVISHYRIATWGYKINDTACSISIPIKEGKPSRFYFQAVVVETSIKEVATLRERFYELAHPSLVAKTHPYTGQYQFIPMINPKSGLLLKYISW
jgi:hypothetical protein